jgi:ATP-dependent DNA helicase RecQ
VPEAMASLRIEAFRGRQEEAIGAILAGNDVLYVFPTGMGKSVVYQVASLCSTGLTIIISPLISLLREQVRNLSALGIPVIEALGGSLQAYQDVDAKLVYCTPEQARLDSELAHYITEERKNVTRIVVDEAHLVCDWESFRSGHQSIVVMSLHDCVAIECSRTQKRCCRTMLQTQLHRAMAPSRGMGEPDCRLYGNSDG